MLPVRLCTAPSDDDNDCVVQLLTEARIITGTGERLEAGPAGDTSLARLQSVGAGSVLPLS